MGRLRHGTSCLAWLLGTAFLAESVRVREGSARSAANPVRKVVTMLQAMDAKIRDEESKEQELFNRFMCYCRGGIGSLEKSVSDAETKIPALRAELESFGEQVGEMKESLKQEQADCDSAKQATAEATGLREKEAAAFDAESTSYDSSIAALKSAVAALEKGAVGSFLQTDDAGSLRSLVQRQRDMMEEDRQEVLAFLSATSASDYAPQSRQIVGILKQLGDTMSQNFDSAAEAEKEAVATYETLMAAKKKEVDALTSSIESKTKKIGELNVAIVEMQADLGDSQDMLGDDQKFQAELQKSCRTKEAEWAERQKTRSAELLTISDTIKTLNDDDALGLFKGSLPAAEASFMQVQVSEKILRRKALRVLKGLHASGSHRLRVSIDLMALALSGKKVNFAKVVQLIDGMIEQLQEEQKADEDKRDYCKKAFDSADDKQKALQSSLDDATFSANSCKSGIESLSEEIAALAEGIRSMDKAVSEQTEQRKDENAEFKDLVNSKYTAMQLLEMAKNRLNRFYSPKLYKPPPKNELAATGAVARDFGVAESESFVQVRSSSRRAEQPGLPPEYFGVYQKSSQASAAVVSMLDMLIKDLDLEVAEAKVEEKNAQEEYEVFMKDSAAKRVSDSKSIAQKESSKASLESDMEEYKAAALSSYKELQNTAHYISAMHAQCDFLTTFFEVRKKARAGEADALSNAKAVLSGADYSLLETGERHRVRRVRFVR